MAALVFVSCPRVLITRPFVTIVTRNVPVSLNPRPGICSNGPAVQGNETLSVEVSQSGSVMQLSFRLPSGVVVNMVGIAPAPGNTVYSFSIFIAGGVGAGTTSAELLPNGLVRVRGTLPPSVTGLGVQIDIQFLVAANFSAISELEIAIHTQADSVLTTTQTLNQTSSGQFSLESMLAIANKNQVDGPLVEMMFQTDMFGNNLGEMNCVVVADKFYPDGYPLRLIGLCEGVTVPKRIGGKIQTLYSARPCLESVLKGKGDTLMAQTSAINRLYDTELDDCEFFNRILAYSTLKYFFAGLVFNCFKTSVGCSSASNGCFSVKWLLRKYNERFMAALLASEFRTFAFIFLNPEFGLVGFDRYYRCCKQDLCNCRSH